jgi:hypothetical protein
MEIELPIFGKTKLEQQHSKYNYEASREKYNLAGYPIDLDIHFKELNETKIAKVSSTLNDLSKIHKIGKDFIRTDFEQGEIVKEYIQEWNEDIFKQIFDEEEFEKFIEQTDKEERIELQLLALIRIVRIGIYAESEESFIIMDLAFGYQQERGFRDNMIAMTLNPDYEITQIDTAG